MAYENDVYTRNEDSELAVRVVTATEGTNNSSYDDVFTRDTNGKLAVRVVGAGGGDSHNLGYFATPQALSEAYPTGEEGDYAIVGSTDTVWIWDSGTSAWVDTDTKGQVESVNGQTGAVTLGINDVAPTQTGKSGYVLGTDGFVAGWVKPEIVQVSAMPVASEDEVDNIYQYVGTTDANYTNGYFYKCVSDGQDPATYSWTQTDVQPQAGGLPDQTGNANTFLVTNGTSASWTNSIPKGGAYFGSYVLQAINDRISFRANGSLTDVNIGTGIFTINDNGNVQARTGWTGVFGWNGNGWKTVVTKNISSTNTGYNNDYLISVPTMTAGAMFVQVSTMPTAGSTYLGRVYQYIGTTDSTYTHGYIYECKAQGTDPETYAWEAVEVQAGGGGGLPDQTGQSGKFLTTDGTDASWSDKPLVNTFSDSTSVGILSYENRAYPRNVVIGTNIRYTAGSTSSGDSVWIGDSVNHPSLTSYWEATNSVIIGSKAAAQENSVVIGYNARGGATNYAFNSVCVGYQAGTNGGDSQVAVGYASKAGYYSVAIGREANAYYSSTYLGAYSIAIGALANATKAGAIQIGKGTNSTSGTLQIGLSTGGAYGTTNQYVLLDSDGTIPEARLADTTNATAGDVLTLDSNGNAVWQAGGSGGGSVPTLTWYSVSTAGNTLTIADTSSARLVKVYKNGLLLQPTDDYTISGTTLTTVAALVVGDKITTEVF